MQNILQLPHDHIDQVKFKCRCCVDELWQQLAIASATASAVQGGNNPAGGEYGAAIQSAPYTPIESQAKPDAAPTGDLLAAQLAASEFGAAVQAHQYSYIDALNYAVGHATGLAADLTLATTALSQTAQANSAPLDLQDADVATTDALLKALQGKGMNNPATLAVQAGKPVTAAAQAPLTAFQNLLVLAPQQAAAAKAPNALPSALQAGAATPIKAPAEGGRKMLASYPDCCNTYTVKAGDTLASIATTYGQPDNGVKYLQAINDLPSGTVTPGQSIMLPCGRVLSYITAHNAGLLTNAASG
ncbi:g11835 [Coccomyxa elongata]